MMRCQDVTHLATDFLDGSLPWHRRAAFRMHLLMCRYCRTYLDQMRETLRRLRRLPPEPVPPSTKEDLLRQFEQQ